MSRIGLRVAASFAFPTPASVASVQLTKKHASGLFGVRAGFRSQSPPIDQYLRNIGSSSQPATVYAYLLRKLWWLGPVKAVPGCGHADARLVDINLEKNKIAELDNDLTDTLGLRSIPLSSLLLSQVANIDQACYEKVHHQLLHTTAKNAPAIVGAISEELQTASNQQPIAPLNFSKPRFHLSYTSATLTSRRGLEELVLKDLPTLGAGIEQHDYTLLNHKIREDPDFPVAPFWHEEYASQRSWRDTTLQLSEDKAGGFFVHEVFLKKLLHELNGSGVFPHAGKLRTLRTSAIVEAKKIMKAEAEMATAEESKRLLRCKIECLVHQVADTEEHLKAVRLIKLETLEAGNVLELSDHAIVTLLATEMRLTMDDKTSAADVETDCICDIISEYSDDVDENYWNKQSVLDVVCNERKRETIANWISSIQLSTFVHCELYIDDRNYCGPLEPTDDTEEDVMEEIQRLTEEEGVYEYPKILFNHDQDGNIILPLADGYSMERSEGYYTNMSGLSSLSSSNSSSSADEEDHYAALGDSPPSARVSFSSKGTSVDDGPVPNPKDTKNHSTEQELDIEHGDSITSTSTDNQLLKDIIADSIIIDKNTTRPSIMPDIRNTTSTYQEKRAAIARGEGINARRLNTLRMAWDIPHHSHGPQQAGYRPHLHGYRHNTRPSPDWDAPGAPKPRFAERVETIGMLDQFNKEYEAKWVDWHGAMPEEVLDVNVFVPPRRPRHEDLMTAINVVFD
ncbi:uncharacterized protein K460DRAFT_405280 [Cucurbitaria berberidis CBS 394.84]|uniref:Uncharacterized protein n=1 Tax=Cucurbitaria berberidis CBS 394.84 TaxID=1168544 RepID=A0A9P4L7I5_9PLEO|nr:uncharacterized protein K460DRAFT_405280 [Cucurbitaria berberidis CBS 394.84]KAF1845000.1 hypothetical protein K460DRAFT_405280 [Cucurbitaria berberidis CBS 394.84]